MKKIDFNFGLDDVEKALGIKKDNKNHDGQTDRQRLRDKERPRETEKDRDTQTETETGRQTNRQRKCKRL